MNFLTKLNPLKRFSKQPSDQRSHRIVMVIDCILNQNSRDLGAANYPSMNKEILRLCMQYNIGIFQIPCPEMTFLGFLRKRKQGQSIRDALDTVAGRECCRKLSIDITQRIQDYINNKNKILAVLGGNPESPGCAIHTISTDTDCEFLTENSGIFMKAFHKELCKKKITIPFRGMRDCRSDWITQDLKWLENIFNQ